MTVSIIQSNNPSRACGIVPADCHTQPQRAAGLEETMKAMHSEYCRDPWEYRLWSRVAINDKTGCWEWTGSVNRTGYGQLRIDRHGVQPHRVAYEMLVGPIPPGIYVCHACDNPICVNPHHLWLGTNSDNQLDAVLKERRVILRGSAHPFAKLTEQQVLTIRQQIVDGKRCADIASEFGVSETEIYHIKTRCSWAHI